MRACCLTLLLTIAPALAVAQDKPAAHYKSDAPEKTGTPVTAQQLWAVTEVILDNHVDPPTRQQMLLSALKKLFEQADATPPQELSRRVSEITRPEQFAALLGEVTTDVHVKPSHKDPESPDALLKGLLDSVPGKPYFMSAAEAKVSKQVSANQYVGTGIQIAMNNREKLTQILNPFRRGPARRAGGRPNDLIVRVDGRSTEKIPLRTVVQWLRGPKGSAVTVDVRQPGSKEVRTLHIVRDTVPIDTVLGYRRASEDTWKYALDSDRAIAYLRINSINSSTLQELRQAERKLQADGARALVLDFRAGSSEGNLHDGELVADGFLDGGVMWRIRDAHGHVKEIQADRDCLFRDWPIAVLIDDTIVDNLTPVVAAALQDNHRAILIGQPTHNDGMVKRLVELPDNLGVITLLTGTLERSAAGRSWPVRPDHTVAVTSSQQKEIQRWLEEKQLTELPAGRTDAPPVDPQLAKAIDIVRAALKDVKSTARP
jgi:carboxyl-terminal processing protease